MQVPSIFLQAVVASTAASCFKVCCSLVILIVRGIAKRMMRTVISAASLEPVIPFNRLILGGFFFFATNVSVISYIVLVNRKFAIMWYGFVGWRY